MSLQINLREAAVLDTFLNAVHVYLENKIKTLFKGVLHSDLDTPVPDIFDI